MDTGEVFAWLVWMVLITLFFFAAFGGSEVSESSIEEYMDRLMKEDNNNGSQMRMPFLR